MTSTLKDLRRVADDPRVSEMLRVEQHLPPNQGERHRDRLAQHADDIKVVRRTRTEREGWATRHAEVESQKLHERYEVAQLEHDQRLSLVAELFEMLGLDQPGPRLDAIEMAYPAASDLVARHVRDVETMGPTRSEKLSKEVSNAHGGIQLVEEQDVIVEAGRAIRDALPELRRWQAHVEALRERAERGIDPAEWDETWCAMIDELQRSLSYPMVPNPDDPDPQPQLQIDVEQRLTEWNLLGGE